MYKIIVASHGPMAQGMKASLEFVMGPAENVSALCLDEEGISKFTENAKKLINECTEREILVMVDFLFGSPFNEFSKLAATYDGKMEIISGVSLPALVEAVSCQEDGDSIEIAIPQIKKSATMKTLKEVIEEALSFLPEAEKKEAVKKSCQRTFQALRIDINSEFEVLYAFLDKLPGALKPGGRAAILTFHSGEDRLVKKAFKEGLKAGIYSEINQDVIRPSAEECAKNGRAKSTKLRWAVKAQE